MRHRFVAKPEDMSPQEWLKYASVRLSAGGDHTMTLPDDGTPVTLAEYKKRKYCPDRHVLQKDC